MCSAPTQVYVNYVKICTNFIGRETKTLIDRHLSICDALCTKFYNGDTKIIIFLPANPSYKPKEKRQVKEEAVYMNKTYIQEMSNLLPLACPP